jgi:hypothetical protein
MIPDAIFTGERASYHANLCSDFIRVTITVIRVSPVSTPPTDHIIYFTGDEDIEMILSRIVYG